MEGSRHKHRASNLARIQVRGRVLHCSTNTFRIPVSHMSHCRICPTSPLLPSLGAHGRHGRLSLGGGEETPSSLANDSLDWFSMDERSITLRPAKPTLEDGLVFARYVNEASEGSFRVMLGRHAADILATVFTQPDHDYSFRHVIFAQDDEAIVGMAEGFAATPGRQLSDQPLLRAAGARAWILRWAAAAAHPLFRIHSTLAVGDFYLQFLAVDAGHRGRGVGSALLDAVEKRARARESTRLAVDVWARNPRAYRLYARRGMVIESRWPKVFVIPGFGLLRMTKRLQVPSGESPLDGTGREAVARNRFLWLPENHGKVVRPDDQPENGLPPDKLSESERE